VLTVLVVVALAIVVVLAARRWISPAHPVSPRDQVDAFTRARAVTNRWSDDPRSTPAPLRAYLAEQRRSHEDQAPESQSWAPESER
jgi:hypothetical protein